jgi:hypothetical protein
MGNGCRVESIEEVSESGGSRVLGAVMTQLPFLTRNLDFFT